MENRNGDVASDLLRRYSAGDISRSDLYARLRTLWGREVFEGTRHCFENMKQRSRKGYATLDPRFEDFGEFLLHMGPRPFKSASIERKDYDKGYSPDNCEWADKTSQSRNRRNTVYLTSNSGETLPLIEWAERLDTSPRAMYHRRRAGLSDEEVIYGRAEGTITVPPDAPWPDRNPDEWEQNFRRDGGRDHADRLHYLLLMLRPMCHDLYAKEVSIARRTRRYRSPEEQDEWQQLNDLRHYYEGYLSKARHELQRLREEREKREALLERRKRLFPHRYRRTRTTKGSDDDDEFDL